MSKLSRAWTSWVDLLDRRERGDSLALFRIAVGLVILTTLLSIISADIVPIIWRDLDEGGYRPLHDGGFHFRLLGGPTAAHVSLVLYTAVAASVALTVGFGGRITAFVLLQCFMALHRLNSETTGSSDILITNALWLLVLARSTETLSVDCFIRSRSFISDAEIPGWPRYLGTLQLVLVYCTTGLQKVSAYWLPVGGYSALFYVLQQPSWVRWELPFLGELYPLTQIATAATWFWEVGSPFLFVILYYRRTKDRPGKVRALINRIDLRIPWVLFGITLHLTIALTMSVGPFSWITMSFYICLFHPEELRAALRWARKKLQREGEVASAAT